MVMPLSPHPASLIYLNFQPLEVVFRYRNPQPQAMVTTISSSSCYKLYANRYSSWGGGRWKWKHLHTNWIQLLLFLAMGHHYLKNILPIGIDVWPNWPRANTKHLYNICTMLDQRRRRWADVVQNCYTNVFCLLGTCHRFSQYFATTKEF